MKWEPRPSRELGSILVAVMMGVQLACFRAVMGGMDAMAQCGVSVARSGFGIVFLVMFGGLAMVMRRFFAMLGGGMMMRAGRMLVRHETLSLVVNARAHPERKINMSICVVCANLMRV